MTKNLNEQIEKEIGWTKKYLKNCLDVDNLSNIESWHLRKVVVECIEQREELSDLAKQGKINGESVFSTMFEAAERWLKNLYGATTIGDYNPSPLNKIVVYGVDGEIYTYDYYTEGHEATKKLKELRSLSATPEGLYHIYDTISPQYKEYIRRLRENSHLI